MSDKNAPAPHEGRCAKCGKTRADGLHSPRPHNHSFAPAPLADGGEILDEIAQGIEAIHKYRCPSTIWGKKSGPCDCGGDQRTAEMKAAFAALRARVAELERVIFDIENECLHTCESDYGTTESCAQHIVMRWKSKAKVSRG